MCHPQSLRPLLTSHDPLVCSLRSSHSWLSHPPHQGSLHSGHCSSLSTTEPSGCLTDPSHPSLVRLAWSTTDPGRPLPPMMPPPGPALVRMTTTTTAAVLLLSPPPLPPLRLLLPLGLLLLLPLGLLLLLATARRDMTVLMLHIRCKLAITSHDPDCSARRQMNDRQVAWFFLCVPAPFG